jgi:hypothetical protein
MEGEYKPKFGQKEYDDVQFKLKRATNLDLYKQISFKARQGVNGLMIGSVVGVVGFWLLNKPVFWGAVLGGVTGGLIEVAVFSKGDSENEKGTV